MSCSLGTFESVKIDENYGRDITGQVLSQKENQFGEEIYSQRKEQNIEEFLDVTGDHHTSQTAGSFAIESSAVMELETTEDIDAIFTPLTELDEEKQYWSEGAVRLMLASIEELKPKVGKCISVKTKARMYQIVSERMAEQNYPFTPTQIENKFRGLERKYKNKLQNRQTVRNRGKYPFEEELTQILGKKKGMHPEFVLDSEEVVGKSVDDECSSDFEQVLPYDTPSCSSQGPKRRKIAPRDELLEKMDKIIEDKREFQSKVLEHMRKKDERAEMKEKRSQRKLELLEKLVKRTK